MSDLAEARPRVPSLLRDRSGVQRVTNIELFFDLVYVFAVTQLSHYLIGHSTVAGALQTGRLESQASRHTRQAHSYLFRLN